MDILKKFLDDVCFENEYSYEKVDTLAEIYQGNEIVPIVLVEWKSDLDSFIVKFRIGVSSLDIARLTNTMSIVNDSLIFDQDFIIDPDYGYLYGEEAMQAFMLNIQNNIQEEQFKDDMEGVIYVSQEPIFTYGSGYIGKTKIEKLWDLDA